MHPEHNLLTAACTWCGLRALVRLCREQCLRLIAGSHEGGHANATMNQKNILPYDGFAYLVNDTNGEFEWPGITACLAEIIPWRIETARLFGRDMSVPRMTAWFGDADYTYSGIRHRAAPFPTVVQCLRERAEAISGASYNAVLLNLYRNGGDSVG